MKREAFEDENSSNSSGKISIKRHKIYFAPSIPKDDDANVMALASSVDDTTAGDKAQTRFFLETIKEIRCKNNLVEECVAHNKQILNNLDFSETISFGLVKMFSENSSFSIPDSQHIFESDIIKTYEVLRTVMHKSVRELALQTVSNFCLAQAIALCTALPTKDRNASFEELDEEQQLRKSNNLNDITSEEECTTFSVDEINLTSGCVLNIQYLTNTLQTLTSFEQKFNPLVCDLDMSIAKLPRASPAIQNNVAPYFFVYELTRKKCSTIVEHPDFIKMIAILRSIMRSYGTLKLKNELLEQLTIWGALQSETTIWFLKCKCEARTIQDKKSRTIIYHITHSVSYNLKNKTDAEKVVYLYCEIFRDGMKLKKNLSELTNFDENATICNTNLSIRSKHDPFIIDTVSVLHIDEISLFDIAASHTIEEFVDNCRLQFGEEFSFSKIGLRATGLICYLVSLTKLVSVDYSKVNESAQTLSICFKHQNIERVAIFTRTNNTSESFKNSSGEGFQQHQSTYFNSLSYHFENEVKKNLWKVKSKVQDYKSIFAIVEDQYLANDFVKITRFYEDAESVSIMKLLSRKQLQHKNIVQVVDYRIVENGVSFTHCEAYLAFTQIRNELSADWLLNNVMLPLLDGLHYLHENQIIHADVSLYNILFTWSPYTAVISDLNYCVPFSVLQDEILYTKRKRICFGTVGFYPSENEKPSVYTDLYGWIVSICSLVYYKWFKKEWIATNFEDKCVEEIFQVNWSEAKMRILMRRIELVYTRIVLIKEKEITVEKIKAWLINT